MGTKPILFNTENVRALLEGRKTVTRRVVKPQPLDKPMVFNDDEEGINIVCHIAGKEVLYNYFPPYQPGDILWVRETWAKSMAGTFMYRADDKAIMVERWHPSIHMPREAARIFLRVTGVRVERLQDINGLHAKEEGCEGYVHINPLYGFPETVHNFKTLWDSTLKPADRPVYGWDANPWVWVIEFERISKCGEDVHTE